jgi:hypothetical protein
VRRSCPLAGSRGRAVRTTVEVAGSQDADRPVSTTVSSPSGLMEASDSCRGCGPGGGGRFWRAAPSKSPGLARVERFQDRSAGQQGRRVANISKGRTVTVSFDTAVPVAEATAILARVSGILSGGTAAVSSISRPGSLSMPSVSTKAAGAECWGGGGCELARRCVQCPERQSGREQTHASYPRATAEWRLTLIAGNRGKEGDAEVGERQDA